jgi:hypothetical protein
LAEGEFSVWLFFPDGWHAPEVERVDARTAVETAAAVTRRPACRTGIVERVIITDGGDHTCFEWTYGKGVTFA